MNQTNHHPARGADTSVRDLPIALPGTNVSCLLCGNRHDSRKASAWLEIVPAKGLGICRQCGPAIATAILQTAFSPRPSIAEHTSELLARARLVRVDHQYSTIQDDAPLKLERVLTLARKHLALLKGIAPEAMDPRTKTYYEYSTILTHLILDDAGSAGVSPARNESEST